MQDNRSLRFDPKAYPDDPGVYMMKDAKGRIIYVGKAKNLRKRLASYFRPAETLTRKTDVMMRKVGDIDVLTTATEKDALLLESSLIKKHRPRYNIVLRDDKQYILFKLTMAHDFPRLTTTRRVVGDGSIYFGPYTSAGNARQAARLIGKVFPLRKCRDHVFKNRVRPCLFYHIKECYAPCVGHISKEDYAELVREVEAFFSGKSKDLTDDLHKRMSRCAEAMEFEEAARLRDRIRAVELTLERQVAVLADEQNMDVAALAENDRGLGLCVLFVRQGRLLDKKTFFWPGAGMEEAGEALRGFLNQFYTGGKIIPERILLPWAPDDPALLESLAERRGGPVRFNEPKTSAEKKLIDTARSNAARESVTQAEKRSIIPMLQAALKLRTEPRRIETVDASHLGGEGVRVGMVVFEDGVLVPDQNRTYAFPELEGSADDYLALASWTKRRIQSGPPWPDLLLIDGGRGQLSSVERAMDEAGMAGFWPLAAIAKAAGEGGGGPDRRAGALEDRIFLPGRKNPLNLKPGGPELLFLQRMRDAAHNNVLGRQRRSRTGRIVESELTSIEGVGPKTARLLWDAFGSIKEMREAPLEDYLKIPGIGRKTAEKIRGALRKDG